MNRKPFSNFIPLKPRLQLLAATLMLTLAACQAVGAPVAAPVTNYSNRSNAPTSAPAAMDTAMPAPTSAPAATSTAIMPAEATINSATDPKLGNYLVDGSGMTLYIFTKDTADKSTCTGGCAKNWPALVTQGSPKLGSGIDASFVGSAQLADGTQVVTYNHMVLYTFIKDKKPGDIAGQSVGNVWYIIAPNGKPVGYNSPAANGSGGDTGGYGSGSGNSGRASTTATSAPASTATTAPAASSGPATVVKLASNATLGQYLVDSQGMALYMYTRDTPNHSTCTGGCANYWPAFLVKGDLKAGSGVNTSLLGTANLANGSKIATYNGMPLYYYANDSKPGDLNGQGSNGVWFVVSPAGNAIGK